MGYNKAVLEDQIRREVNRTAYITCDADASTLSEMLSEINLLGYSFRYLAELIQCKISDKSSRIILTVSAVRGHAAIWLESYI